MKKNYHFPLFVLGAIVSFALVALLKEFFATADPVAKLYGRGKGQGLTRILLEERAKERKKENSR